MEFLQYSRCLNDQAYLGFDAHPDERVVRQFLEFARAGLERLPQYDLYEQIEESVWEDITSPQEGGKAFETPVGREFARDYLLLLYYRNLLMDPSHLMVDPIPIIRNGIEVASDIAYRVLASMIVLYYPNELGEYVDHYVFDLRAKHRTVVAELTPASQLYQLTFEQRVEQMADNFRRSAERGQEHINQGMSLSGIQSGRNTPVRGTVAVERNEEQLSFVDELIQKEGQRKSDTLDVYRRMNESVNGIPTNSKPRIVSDNTGQRDLLSIIHDVTETNTESSPEGPSENELIEASQERQQSSLDDDPDLDDLLKQTNPKESTPMYNPGQSNQPSYNQQQPRLIPVTDGFGDILHLFNDPRQPEFVLPEDIYPRVNVYFKPDQYGSPMFDRNTGEPILVFNTGDQRQAQWVDWTPAEEQRYLDYCDQNRVPPIDPRPAVQTQPATRAPIDTRGMYQPSNAQPAKQAYQTTPDASGDDGDFPMAIDQLPSQTQAAPTQQTQSNNFWDDDPEPKPVAKTKATPQPDGSIKSFIDKLLNVDTIRLQRKDGVHFYAAEFSDGMMRASATRQIASLAREVQDKLVHLVGVSEDGEVDEFLLLKDTYMKREDHLGQYDWLEYADPREGTVKERLTEKVEVTEAEKPLLAFPHVTVKLDENPADTFSASDIVKLTSTLYHGSEGLGATHVLHQIILPDGKIPKERLAEFRKGVIDSKTNPDHNLFIVFNELLDNLIKDGHPFMNVINRLLGHYTTFVMRHRLDMPYPDFTMGIDEYRDALESILTELQSHPEEPGLAQNFVDLMSEELEAYATLDTETILKEEEKLESEDPNLVGGVGMCMVYQDRYATFVDVDDAPAVGRLRLSENPAMYKTAEGLFRSLQEIEDPQQWIYLCNNQGQVFVIERETQDSSARLFVVDNCLQ